MSLFLKRTMDIVLSAMAMVIFLPLFFVIAVLIKLDSEGPVFFKQERRTKNGKLFKMLKFRSMVVDAEKQAAGLFNYENDPRVTKIGRWMRNKSIDELPQLINVFFGSMSLVGPRPCVSYELGDFETLNRKYKKRFQMKAGITGLAQVRGRNNISWDEKVELDNQYIDLFKRKGVLVDIRLLFETVANVSKSKDIYEIKEDESMNDAEAAKQAENEIIRLAHLPDEDIA